jgi:hypothetical protein
MLLFVRSEGDSKRGRSTMRLRYDLDDAPPLAEFLLFGLQWLAISIPGIIIVGKVVCGLHFTVSRPVAYHL